MRPIDADALIDDLMERYCKECNKRRGIKNGKYRIIYEIGEAPCRACEVDDVKAELEEAPTAEPERKKGRWIKHEDRPCWYCSECNEDNYYAYVWSGDTGIYVFQDNFCPHCGAEMTGGAE